MPKQFVHGIELYYEMSGQGEPILFIHGLGSSTRDWQDQVAFFAPHYTVITVDLRGHGQSTRPQSSYSIAIFAADMVKLLHSLNCAPAHIVGLSLGGSVAFEMAVMAPDVVRSLVIVNSAPEIPRSTLKQRVQRFILWVQRWLIVRLSGMRKMGEVLSQRLFIKPEQEEQRRDFVERWATNDKNAYLASFKALLNWSVAKQLEKIKQPTLIVSADEDYTPVAYKEAYMARMPNAELAVIRDSRHLTPVERPEAFNQALSAFLAKHAQPAAETPASSGAASEQTASAPAGAPASSGAASEQTASAAPFTTLITADELAKHLDDPDWAVFDCRFELQDPQRGRRDYAEAHIPGALYAHLDEDLASAIVPGVTGRHPLPDVETFARTLSAWGIDSRVQVVVYDDMGGALAAARLWWMLRWLGHEAVAVLDGGWQKWQSSGYPVSSEPAAREPRQFEPRPREHVIITTEEVLQRHTDPALRLFDVRKPPRYRGEMEPMDPVAGHIPGAISAPFEGNLGDDGLFLPVAELRSRYEKLLAGAPAEQTAFYCGSGATSAHSVLAMLHAGMGEPRLYVGSWSEWCADPSRPVEQGG